MSYLWLFLLALLVAIAYHEIYTPGSNLHRAIEHLLGSNVSASLKALVALRNHRGGEPAPPAAGERLESALWLSTRLTSVYCEYISPTPLTCDARIGFREMVRHLCGENRALRSAVHLAVRLFANTLVFLSRLGA